MVLRSSEGCSPHGNPGVGEEWGHSSNNPLPPTPKRLNKLPVSCKPGVWGWAHKPSTGDLQGTRVQTVAPTLGSRHSGHRCYRQTPGPLAPGRVGTGVTGRLLTLRFLRSTACFQAWFLSTQDGGCKEPWNTPQARE